MNYNCLFSNVTKGLLLIAVVIFLSFSIYITVAKANVTLPNEPPIVNAGTDKNVYKLTTMTTTNASASDPEGLPLTYEWTTLYTLDGYDPVILNANTLTPTFTGLVGSGLHSFQLTVTDSEGLTASDILNIWMIDWDGGTIVRTENGPIQPSLYYKEGYVQFHEYLSGYTTTASINDYGILPEFTDFEWSIINPEQYGDGFLPPVITNGDTLTPTFSNFTQIPRVYDFRLTASSNEGYVVTGDLTLNPIPWEGGQVVNAGNDFTFFTPATEATSTGIVNDYGILPEFTDFLWTTVTYPFDGIKPIILGASSLTPTFSALTGTGLYTFRLTATSDSGYEVSDYINIFRVNPTVLQWAGASDCVIPNNQSTCDSLVTWYFDGMSSWDISIQQEGIEFSTASLSFGEFRPIGHGMTEFTFTDRTFADNILVATRTATATCMPGSTLMGSVCVAPGSSPASLTTINVESGCEVTQDQSECEIGVEWDIQGPIGYTLTPSIRQNGAQFSTEPFSRITAASPPGAISRSIQLGANTFDFYDNDVLLAQWISIAYCAGGTVPVSGPDGVSRCKLVPTAGMSASPNLTDGGGTSLVSWEIYNLGGSTSNCEVVGRYDATGDVIDEMDGAAGNLTTSELYGDATYILTCDDPVLNALGNNVLNFVKIDVNTTPEIMITPRIVPPGSPDNALVTWNTRNQDQTLCTLNGGGLNNYALPDSGNSMVISVTAQSTVRLSCPNPIDPANPFTASFTIEILPSSFET